jgi:hypothetical protein
MVLLWRAQAGRRMPQARSTGPVNFAATWASIGAAEPVVAVPIPPMVVLRATRRQFVFPATMRGPFNEA